MSEDLRRTPLDAATVLAAYDGARALDRSQFRSPASLEEARALQGELNEARIARGERPLGRKIGFTNRAMWSVYGVHHPIWAPVWDSTVTRVAEGDTTVVSVGRFVEPQIEPEIALRVTGMPRSADPDEVAASIDAVAHSVEIVQSPWPGWKFDGAEAIAAQALHGALLLGPAVPVSQATSAKALAAADVWLSCDGQPVAQGRGANALDGPVAALAHLVAELRRTGHPLAPGEWVSTGTLTDAKRVFAGQRWRTHLEGVPLPAIDVQFVE